MQRTRREPTVRRLGLNLTDSLVVAPPSRDVLRPMEREKGATSEAVRQRRSTERRGVQALPLNPSIGGLPAAQGFDHYLG